MAARRPSTHARARWRRRSPRTISRSIAVCALSAWATTWADEDQGVARHPHRGGSGARRRGGSYLVLRTSGPRQDHACDGRRQRAGREHQDDERPRHRAHGRSGGHPHEPRGGDVLFIDEIHRLNRMVEEVLYPALETSPSTSWWGRAGGTLHSPRPAALHPGRRHHANGLLTGPLRDRFGIVFRLQYYSPRSWPPSCAVPPPSWTSQSRRTGRWRSRAVAAAPRVWRTACSSACAIGAGARDGIIDEDVAAQALSFFEVDALGLDMMDNRILELLAVQFGGRPVG